MSKYKHCIILFIIFAIISFKKVKNHFSSKYDIRSLFKIRVAFYCMSLKYGGVERVTSILLNYLSKKKLFTLFLITTKPRLDDEYPLSDNIIRISLSNHKRNLFKQIKKEKIDILIYNFYDKNEIKRLNKLKKIKVIYYNHSSYFIWLFYHIFNFEKSIYNVYKNCKYVLSLIPLENDYLFKIWGIKSIFINNPSTYEYDSVIPSNLSTKNIIMIGRGDDPTKRFDLGILAMKDIIKEIPNCKMNIISESYNNLQSLIKTLNLSKNVKIVGYQKNPELYFTNASLHIFPSICDTYAMVISETKIFGIPTIICGVDYLALAKNGTVIIYDNNPNYLAREAINILNDEKYRKKLGLEARESMKAIKNDLIINKWTTLLLSVYRGIDSVVIQNLLNDEYIPIKHKEANEILNNQLNIYKKHFPQLKEATLDNLKLFLFE